MELLFAVLGGLIVAAIIGAWNWLRVAENRERLQQRLCRHRWRSLDERNEPGGELVFLSPYDEECVKCGARR